METLQPYSNSGYGSNGEVWVAVGISVRWETEMVYNVDDVKVTIS